MQSDQSLSTKVALWSIILKKAATHIVTSHTYTTGSPEVRRTYAAGARYVDPWSQRIKSIQRMQGKTRKRQYYTQVARQ